ncbi:hypothetical protein BCV70DRAFT_222889 [Testicularia cyperi]|uniref:Uncharacterized protein n=1 Tax=Testicularia cyperi TaxID=1882483 RepID=A0A317XV79_9BASI|nr:hypothetical protein BCV70DRAFT_222889 [Testicularia cyperi]
MLATSRVGEGHRIDKAGENTPWHPQYLHLGTAAGRSWLKAGTREQRKQQAAQYCMYITVIQYAYPRSEECVIYLVTKQGTVVNACFYTGEYSTVQYSTVQYRRRSPSPGNKSKSGKLCSTLLFGCVTAEVFNPTFAIAASASASASAAAAAAAAAAEIDSCSCNHFRPLLKTKPALPFRLCIVTQLRTPSLHDAPFPFLFSAWQAAERTRMAKAALGWTLAFVFVVVVTAWVVSSVCRASRTRLPGIFRDPTCEPFVQH